MPLISLSGAGVRYRIDFREEGKLLHESFWALKDIDAVIEKGEAVAVIGENGTGKSTLLKLVAGVLAPDEGTIAVGGRAAGIMEIGGGLQPEMTGTENIRLLSSLYGLSEAESQARLPEVASFAALGRFINAPVKSYSQGMLMRLAFAIAIHIDADILLIDDTFSVGDAYAQKKCLNRIFELRERGTTILCVSHDLEMVRRLCGRGIFLRDGRVVMDGPIEKVSRFYTETVGDRRGIAILENGDACCVFNNGGLMFRWKGESFTARPMESSFRLGGRNYFSQAAQWEAARVPGGRGILATGRWPERGVRQSWKIDIAENGGFDISVSADTPEPPEVSETRIFLSKEFTRWSSLGQDREFAADFEFEKTWNISLVEDPDNRFIMASGETVPGVVIDRGADFSAECDAGNTGADTGARILQFRRHGRSQRGATGWSSCFSARIRMTDTPDAEAERRTVREGLKTVTRIERDPLTAGVSKGLFELSWRYAAVTAGCGLSVGFSDRRGNSYNVKDGIWEIAGTQDGGIHAVVKWLGTPSLAPMHLSFVPEGANGLALKVSMDSDWERVEVQLCLNPAYGQWRTRFERGCFGDAGPAGVLLGNYINSVLGAAGAGLPGVSFDAGEGRFCSYVFRDGAGVNLRFVAIPARGGVPELTGGRIEFAGKITLDEGTAPALAAIPEPVRLKKGMLTVETAGGKGRLFWRGTELTCGLGIYTSFFFGESWIDSSQADWSLAQEGAKITATGRWPWFPIEQSWTVSAEGERAVRLTVSYRQARPLAGLKAQVNLMLSPRYASWRAARAQGVFPADFICHNGKFWERLWAGESACASAGARGGLFGRSVPGVELRRGEKDAGMFCVENTDDLFRARLLQFEPRLVPADAGAGIPVFDGTITVL